MENPSLFKIIVQDKNIFLQYNDQNQLILRQIAHCESQDIAKLYEDILHVFILEEYLKLSSIQEVVEKHFIPIKQYPPPPLEHDVSQFQMEFEKTQLSTRFPCSVEAYNLDIKIIKGKHAIVYEVPYLGDSIILVSSYNIDKINNCFKNIQSYIDYQKQTKNKTTVQLFDLFKRKRKQIFSDMNLCSDLDTYKKIEFANVFEMYIKQEAQFNFVLYIVDKINNNTVNVISSFDFSELEKIFVCLHTLLLSSLQLGIPISITMSKFSPLNRHRTIRSVCPNIDMSKIN